jgi:hypothetical protein
MREEGGSRGTRTPIAMTCSTILGGRRRDGRLAKLPRGDGLRATRLTREEGMGENVVGSVVITLPLDSVEGFLTTAPFGDDAFDFVIVTRVVGVRGRGPGRSSQPERGVPDVVGFEERSIEGVMIAREGRRELQLGGVGVVMNGEDAEGANESGFELGRVGEVEVLGREPNLIPDFEGVRSATPIEVSSLSELRLDHVIAGGLDARLEPMKEHGGRSGREMGVSIESQRGARIKTVGCLERRTTQAGVEGGVIGEFHGDEVLVPSLVEAVQIMFQGVKDSPVRPLRETLSLRMIGCGHPDRCAAELEERRPELRGEDRASIGVHSGRKTMIAEDLGEINLCHVGGEELLHIVATNRYAADLPSQVVREGDVVVMSISAHGQWAHKVDPDSSPRELGERNRGS